MARNTRNNDPFKPRTDESLALCHPYQQQGVAFIHFTQPAPSRMGRTSRSVQEEEEEEEEEAEEAVFISCVNTGGGGGGLYS